MTVPDDDRFPYSFACKRSGNCCAIPGGFVRVTSSERQALAQYLGLDESAFASRYLQPDGIHLKEGLGNRCVFLVDGAQAGCGVYPVRPHKCREWPYWPEILQDDQLREMVERTCPGIEPRS
jgi:uncharacterized protein